MVLTGAAGAGKGTFGLRMRASAAKFFQTRKKAIRLSDRLIGQKYERGAAEKDAGRFIREINEYSFEDHRERINQPWTKTLSINYERSLSGQERIATVKYPFGIGNAPGSCRIYEHVRGLVIANPEDKIIGFHSRRNLPSLEK